MGVSCVGDVWGVMCRGCVGVSCVGDVWGVSCVGDVWGCHV